MATDLDWHWTWAISIAGLLLWIGYLGNLLIELRTLAVVWPPVVAFLLGTGLSGALVYAGYRFSREEWIDSSHGWRIVLWGFGILLLVTGLRGVTIAIRIAEGRVVSEPALDLLVSVSAGLIAGVLGGYLYERAKHDAETARQIQEAVTFLNRTIRHECLNGLAVVQGHVAEVRDQVTDNDHRRRLGLVHARAVDMTDMIQNIRVFVQTYTGQIDLEVVALSDLLLDEVSDIRATYSGATVTTDIPSDIRIRANEGIKFVFKNVLENAVNHNDKPTPEIDVGVEVTQAWVTVTIADNGPGIPDEKRERVFEPELERDHQFGLYLVQTLLTHYDGTIEIAANEPEGTVVTVVLPRVTDRAHPTDEAIG